MAAIADVPRRRRGYVFAAAAAVVGASSLLVAATRGETVTTYAAASDPAYALDIAAGLVTLAAGAIAYWTRPRGAVGPLLVAIGVTWFAADWVGWGGGWAIARSVAMIVVPFAAPLTVHLAFAYPTGRLAGRTARGWVAAAYVATAIGAVGRAMYRDPFRDLHCWSNCRDNVFLVRPDRELARWFDAFGLRTAIVVGTCAAAVAVWRLARMSAVARRAAWFVLVPVAAAAVAQAAYAAALAADSAEDPQRAMFARLFLARAVALVAVGVGVLWSVARAVRTRRDVARLADALGASPAPGSLRARLADSLGDDRLEVAYWLAESARYVDASGNAVTPRPGPGQAATTIARSGHPLAVVVHDAALADDRDLVAEIGAAARLAVDNERLRAEVLAQLDELQASRARIVAAGDATRRQLERDLHDGAQQRLLAVLYELRLAAATAGARGQATEAQIVSATEATQQALTDLRNLAHGIHPAILTESGLGPALATLADRSPIPVDLAVPQDRRWPVGAEAAAYLVVADTVADAVGGGAGHATAQIRDADGAILVDVRHDGATISPDVVVHLADRVGALGGELAVDGVAVRACIPCES